MSKKWEDRRSDRTRQKNKRTVDRKVESNYDSPEIPHRGRRHQKCPASIRGIDVEKLASQSVLSNQLANGYGVISEPMDMG